MSFFDIIGALAWMFSTAPINSDFVYGAIGTEATCKIQGWAFQIGFTSIFYNVSLSTYYLLVIVYGWRDRRLKKNRWWLHGLPLAVGTGLAFGGLPFYQNTIFGCHIQSPPVFEETWYPVVFFVLVPVFGAIFLTTVMMMILYWKVRQQNRRASRWKFPSAKREGSSVRQRGGVTFFGSRTAKESAPPVPEDAPSGSSSNKERLADSPTDKTSDTPPTTKRTAKRRRSTASTTGSASSRLERQVFVQSVLYLSAFYFCWSFMLAAQIEASPVGVRQHYVFPFYLTCFIMAPLQGAWNAVIYFRPRLESRWSKWRCCCCITTRPQRESDSQNNDSSGWSRIFAHRRGGSSLLAASSGGEPIDNPSEEDPSILIATSEITGSDMMSSSANNDGDDVGEFGSMSAIQEELAQLDEAEGMIEDFAGEEN